MSRPERLLVYLDGEPIAVADDRGMGFVGLSFTERALDRYREEARVLSLSVPVAPEVPVERSTRFLRGLLPEGRTLDWVAAQRRLSTNDTFGLLRELGRDCAGALVIVPEGETIDPAGEVDWLTDAELETWIRTLPDHPLGLDPEGEVRLSLAGVQDKLVVCVDPDGGTIGRPLRGTPTTHILKPPSTTLDRAGSPRTPRIVENEAFCMHVARLAGIDVAATQVRTVGPDRTLLIERFDRRRTGAGVVRLHQEDACQALAIDPLHKYEAQGGPSIAQIGRLIRDFAAEPLRDLYRLLDLSTLNFVVGNLDAHGKNVSFLHHPGGSITLAPGYDILSVTAYPAFGRGTLAMRLGRADRSENVSLESIIGAYAACGLSERVARRRVPGLLEAIEQALGTARDAAAEENRHEPLLDTIAEDTGARIHRLLDG